MYAVIKTGGKQYRVAQGDRLRVEKLAGNVGDAVTLASRIEGLTKELGQSILVSEQTRAQAGTALAWTAMVPTVVKGVVDRVATFVPTRS